LLLSFLNFFLPIIHCNFYLSIQFSASYAEREREREKEKVGAEEHEVVRNYPGLVIFPLWVKVSLFLKSD
jgi:hypothetical protein